MPVPDFQTLMLPLLKIAADGQQHSAADAVDLLARQFQLSNDDRGQLLTNGQPRFNNRVGWASTYLKKAGLLESPSRGVFQITGRGRELLAEPPDSIDIAFLESRFQEIVEFRKARPKGDPSEEPAQANPDGTWTLRSTVLERIRRKIEASIPDASVRRDALLFLAAAVANADEERRDAWSLEETPHGLRLIAGRLLACKVSRGRMRVSVVGPVNAEQRSAIGADTERDEEFRLIPSGVLITFPVEHASKAKEVLLDGLNSFVDTWRESRGWNPKIPRDLRAPSTLP